MEILKTDFNYVKLDRSVDLKSLADLARICFNMNVEDDYFNWKYFDNPAGEAIAYAALNGDQIVAFSGIIPEWYWDDGQKVKIYQAIDTMTHPDFRRFGLFAKLAKMCYDDIASENYVIVAFPVPASYSGFVQKLGWEIVCLNKLWFCYSFAFYLRFPFLKAGNSGFEYRQLTSTEEKIVGYLNGRRPGARIEKWFNKEVFDWKVFHNRYRRCEALGIYKANSLVGMVVYFIDSPKSCQVLWIDSLDPADFDTRFLKYLLQHLFCMTKRRCIYLWPPKTAWHKKVFKQSGFMTNPFSKGPFSQTFPLIVLSEKFDHWKEVSRYNFQGIMLD